MPLILAITLHEAGHGFVASWLGDDTARRQGRVTLNPLAHVDPFGTLILPGVLLLVQAGFLFGYAKPVPVDGRNLRRPKRDMIWVALAGPGTNLILALVAALLMPVVAFLPGNAAPWAIENLHNLIIFSILLAVFNMLPVPPLDGGRVAVGLLPRRQALALARLEPVGIFIVLGVFLLVPMLTRPLGLGFDPFAAIILRPTDFIYKTLMGLVA
ncbi:MAG: site-2 protease family protein [Pseudomonadota bacterium]